jgi:ion channel
MAIRKAQQLLGRVFSQRCFYLFIVLLAFPVAAPFIDLTPQGKFLIAVLNCLVVVCAVAAVGRTVLSFVIVSLLASAALVFFWLSLEHDDPAHLARSWGFAAALYLTTIVYLLSYVFRPEVMTADKLFGAAAAYLMIASLWAMLYGLTNLFYPGSFVGLGEGYSSSLTDYLYFSYTVLTSGGVGDIVPKTRQARAICNLQQLVGALYVAILIARLAGVYPPMPQKEEKENIS